MNDTNEIYAETEIGKYTREQWLALQDKADAVEELNCGTLMDRLDLWEMDYEASSKHIMNWVRSNGAHYRDRPEGSSRGQIPDRPGRQGYLGRRLGLLLHIVDRPSLFLLALAGDLVGLDTQISLRYKGAHGPSKIPR